MAISINVGGSKKVSKNYDSQGVSLNVTAEVPNDALSEPQKIADTAHDLFNLVHQLLDEQIAQLSQTDQKSSSPATNGDHARSRANGNGNGQSRIRTERTNSNGHANGSRNPDRRLTQAQQRAIENMARRLGEDPDLWAKEEYGVNKLTELSVRQASEFIDVLKKAIEDQQPQETRA